MQERHNVCRAFYFAQVQLKRTLLSSHYTPIAYNVNTFVQYFCTFFVPARDMRTSPTGTNGHPHRGQERVPGMDVPASTKGTRGSLAKNGEMWYNEKGRSIEKIKMGKK